MARVKKINKQTIDPAYSKIPLRKFVSCEEYVGQNKQREFWINKALEKL